MKKTTLSIVAMAAMMAACSSGKKDSAGEAEVSEVKASDVGAEAKDNTLTAAEKSEGWQLLFDGKSAEGWRGYNAEELPSGWIIENSNFIALGKGGDIGGDVVYGPEEFGEFELKIDWKIAEGGNSGIFYHIVDEATHEAPYNTAPEYQVIDQIGFPQKLEMWQSIGADYGMYTPDFEGAVKPAGEWNTTRIVFTEDKAEYFLNGKKTVSFDPWSEDWEKRKAEGKWKDYPDYGVAKSGLIGLQDHGAKTWYKNIKIRKL
ncbi:DUF1080 domain-containing protein [Echinicola strongylocentroti]|uniref:DUF1080 domain-containing protein n=1 Tax=Echinicola strongylocentroti TaxID=1795355 RepID=A0A2Z4IEC9_9BACT|nr:DUF1080 domain-containing protein [Echinicola strongylocentroti]AWW29264.1 DUF1080 domain-containing protein [Echinicola strongylocentroti]